MYGIVNGTGLITLIIAYAVIGLMIVLVLFNEFGIYQRIRERITRFKESRDIWDFNPLMLIFGGFFIIIFFLVDTIKNFFIKYRHQIIMSIVHLVVLIPLGLNIIGVIERLPEFYFPLFLMYLIMTMLIFVARADDKKYRQEHRGDNRYGYSYDKTPNRNKAYGYQSSTYLKPKPKPKGLSKEQVEKRKKKIREKISENQELKNKYSL